MMVPGSLIFNEAGGFTPLSNKYNWQWFLCPLVFLLFNLLFLVYFSRIQFTCFPNYYYYYHCCTCFLQPMLCLAHIPFFNRIIKVGRGSSICLISSLYRTLSRICGGMSGMWGTGDSYWEFPLRRAQNDKSGDKRMLSIKENYNLFFASALAEEHDITEKRVWPFTCSF